MADTETNEVVGTSPEVLREQALRRVRKRRDFHAHLFVYVAVNAAIWGVWAVIGTTSDSWYPWPMWITLGWGLAVLFNAWDVYLRRPITEREIHDEMDRLAQRR
jgi:2TM domain-containing protein